MPVILKGFNELNDLGLSAVETGLELKKNKFQTAQGLTFDEYGIFKNANQVKNKNYSINVLSDTVREIDFLKPFDKEDGLNSFTTKLAFQGVVPLSSSNFLNCEFTGSGNSSPAFLGFPTENSNFTVNLLSEEDLTIKVNQNGTDKFFLLDPTDENKPIFKTLDTQTTGLCSHIFQYNLDREKGLLQLNKTIYGFPNHLTIITPLTSGNLLSAVNPNIQYGTYGEISTIKLTNFDDVVKYESKNNYNLYKLDNNRTVSDESLSGLKSNFMSYVLPERISSNKDGYFSDLRFFNLKNQLSNNYNTNYFLPVEDKSTQRLYTSILNYENKEKDNENLNLGYNFYTKEYKFLPDKYTKFTLPNSLYPFSRININDTNLSNNGAYAGESPYFSDKVFKLLDKNKNDIPQNQRQQVLFLQDNKSTLLTQDGNRIDIQYFLQDEFENNGTFLCSWLSGNNTEKGKWFDRYYYPEKTSYTIAITGNKNQVFDYQTLAKRYFLENNINDLYYDIPSTMVFEPRSTYYYQRVGSKYMKKIIDGQYENILKDSFTITLSNQVLDGNNNFNLNLKAYDKINLFTNEKSFSVTFDLNLDSLSSLNAYNVFGNFYNDGLALLNNFYTTPFIILPQKNDLLFFNTDFELLQKNTYSDVDEINDVLYLEQTNDLILICNDRIIKTSFNGEISDQLINTDLVQEICTKLYRDRIIDGFSIAYLLKNNISSTIGTLNGLYEFDLQSLSISAAANQTLSAGNSLVQTPSGLRQLEGFLGKKLNENVGISVNETRNEVIFQNLGDLTSFSSNISTNKYISDINVFEDDIYLQTFDKDKNGGIYRFNTERRLLSTYNLSVSSVSGYGIEFINENDEIKLLSLTKNEDEFIIADKFNLNNSLSSTKTLSISSNVLSGGDAFKNRNFVNPVSFSNLYAKYRDKQGDLYFRVNIDPTRKVQLKKDLWNNVATSTLSTWNSIPLTQKQKWQTFFTEESDLVETENFIKIDNLKLKNTFTFNFNLDNGVIQIYLNARKIKQFEFSPNLFTINKLLFPDFFFNTPIIFNRPLSELTNNNNFYSKGATVSNLKVYDNLLSQDFIKFLHLNNTHIDDLILDVPCGSRSNSEEIQNLYNYNIPGYKNNTIKVYIRNALIAEEGKEKITKYLSGKLQNVLPSNVSKIIYNYDINT